MKECVVNAGSSRLSVMRNGGAVVRAWKIPKPMVLVDTREQMPFRLEENHPNWIGGEKRVKLATGDYSVEGMQDILSLERKSLADAIEAKFGIPVLYTSQYRALATEKAASWLSKHFTYRWLEQINHDRTLIDIDGL